MKPNGSHPWWDDVNADELQLWNVITYGDKSGGLCEKLRRLHRRSVERPLVLLLSLFWRKISCRCYVVSCSSAHYEFRIVHSAVQCRVFHSVASLHANMICGDLRCSWVLCGDLRCPWVICGDLRWLAVICVDLRWSAVSMSDLRWSAVDLRCSRVICGDLRCSWVICGWPALICVDLRLICGWSAVFRHTAHCV